MIPTLLLELCLVPALIWGVSLIGRRWGAAVAGWLAAPCVAARYTLAAQRLVKRFGGPVLRPVRGAAARAG